MKDLFLMVNDRKLEAPPSFRASYLYLDPHAQKYGSRIQNEPHDSQTEQGQALDTRK